MRLEYLSPKLLETSLIDICQDIDATLNTGHLITPSFPELYPPDRNCTCLLQGTDGGQIHMSTVLFLMKAARPCADWLTVYEDDHHRGTFCGFLPEEKEFKGYQIKIDFKSNSHNEDMGFWLNFAGTHTLLTKKHTAHILKYIQSK